MWGIRVIVPRKLSPQVLEEIHASRSGNDEGLAESYIWRPEIDKEIEETANTCLGCQLMQAEPSATHLFIRGNGHRHPGSKYTLILPDPPLAACF